MMYHALKMAVACLPAVLFGLGAEGKASTLLVADNEPGNPIVGELDTNSVLPVVIFTHAFSVPGQINGISLGPNGQVFVATDGGIYDYTRDGALLRQFRRIVGFGSFGDLASDGTTLFVADNELGGPIVGELDTNSVLPVVIFTHDFSVPGPINGISLGPNGQVFVATDGGIYDYTRDGALLHQFRRIVGFGSFGDLASDGTTLFVADNELGGPIVGELDTNSVLPVVIFTHAFSVPGPINGISLGPNGQVFVATDGGIYDYTRDGALLRQFRRIVGFGAFGDLAFDGAGSGTTVPEPSTAFLLIIGLFAVAASSRSLRYRLLPSRADGS